VIDHVVLDASNLPASRAFYEQSLAPLGIAVLADHEGYLGFGEMQDRGETLAPLVYFWLTARTPASSNVHLAFTTDERSKVDEFHAAALAAGGTDNGAPGVREIYHPDYYGAFVLDPDGNNIEAVCHAKEY
jgi:catechol 2,3-dioxygenase-like lactoylglutathione lyase family enzyme